MSIILTISQVVLYMYLLLLAVGCVVTVLAIDQPRPPISRETALVLVVINLIVAWAVLVQLQT